jgi:hypothetical protein
MGNGHWAMGNGQWAMGNGQGLAIGKGALPAIALPLHIGERCKPNDPPAQCAAPFKTRGPIGLLSAGNA